MMSDNIVDHRIVWNSINVNAANMSPPISYTENYNSSGRIRKCRNSFEALFNRKFVTILLELKVSPLP